MIWIIWCESYLEQIDSSSNIDTVVFKRFDATFTNGFQSSKVHDNIATLHDIGHHDWVRDASQMKAKIYIYTWMLNRSYRICYIIPEICSKFVANNHANSFQWRGHSFTFFWWCDIATIINDNDLVPSQKSLNNSVATWDINYIICYLVLGWSYQ